MRKTNCENPIGSPKGLWPGVANVAGNKPDASIKTSRNRDDATSRTYNRVTFRRVHSLFFAPGRLRGCLATLATLAATLPLSLYTRKSATNEVQRSSIVPLNAP